MGIQLILEVKSTNAFSGRLRYDCYSTRRFIHRDVPES